VWVKHLLPASLFGRALLILVVPMLVVQAVATYMFYARHWESVQRHLAASLAGEVALITQEMAAVGPVRARIIAHEAEEFLGLRVTLLATHRLPEASRPTPYPVLEDALQRRLHAPFVIRQEVGGREYFTLSVRLMSGVVRMEIPVKRLENPTTYIYILWLTGTGLVFLLVAVWFLRSQIRPIVRLSAAAEAFGKGEDNPQFKPQGAREVRRAGQAFLTMRDRIRRQITRRTEMLAAVSHDLRSPITRMKLELELLKTDHPETVAALRGDLDQMERIIAEYLDFVRGVGTEIAEATDLSALLREMVGRYTRQQQAIHLQAPEHCVLALRPLAFQRVLTNLLDNGLRYGTEMALTLTEDAQGVELTLDDNGPGIPAAQRKDALTPFRRLESSRNSETGGVGLGLTIARDIVHTHGGNLFLEDAPGGGLRVKIRLPR
jgi:two-component system osmolarity sensor histidine kinase EnvZ